MILFVLKNKGENASTALTLKMPLKSHGRLLDIHFNEKWEIRMVPDHLIYHLDRHYQTLNLPSKIDFIRNDFKQLKSHFLQKKR